MIAADNQIAVVTAIDSCSCFTVSHSAGVNFGSGAENCAVSISSAVEGHIGGTAQHCAGSKVAFNAEGIAQKVVTGDGQIAIGTDINALIGNTVVSDTAGTTINGSDIVPFTVFGIGVGSSAEGHAHSTAESLFAAELSGSGN